MTKKEIKLKGSLHGTKKIMPYKKPDIIRSTVDHHLCLINDVTVKYLEDKQQFYIYHSYRHEDSYSGRWYMRNYEYNPSNFNAKNHTFSIELKSIDWEDFETGEIKNKNVTVEIEFTPSGFEKFAKYFVNNVQK